MYRPPTQCRPAWMRAGECERRGSAGGPIRGAVRWHARLGRQEAGRGTPEDDSVPLHDIVVAWRPIHPLGRVGLHPLEVTHQPPACGRTHAAYWQWERLSAPGFRGHWGFTARSKYHAPFWTFFDCALDPVCRRVPSEHAVQVLGTRPPSRPRSARRLARSRMLFWVLFLSPARR